MASKNIETQISHAISRIILDIDVEIGFTCLAVGVDQLFAKVLNEAGIGYIAVIPCKRYEETFHGKHDLAKYKAMLSRAAAILELPNDSPTEKAFFEAGMKVVDSSDFMIVVWDGCPAEGIGGTGDIVEYSMRKHKFIKQINPQTMVISELK